MEKLKIMEAKEKLKVSAESPVAKQTNEAEDKKMMDDMC